MKTRNRFGWTARLAAAGLVVLGVGALAFAARAQGAKTQLERPDPATDDDAVGNLSVKHFDAVGNRPERSWIRVRARHLERKADYSLWLDDPSTEGDNTLVEFGTFTTNGGGNENHRIDTKKGGTLPFDATIDGLAGMAFEIRDANGDVVLQGNFPDITPDA